MIRAENLGQVLDDLNPEKPEENSLSKCYRILLLEDNPDDAELMQFELSEADFQFVSHRVDKKIEFLRQVFDFKPDIVLADYSLSTFNGMDAFHMLKEEKLVIPFILVTGVLSEQLALECVKEGVDDFVLKSSFKRLPSAILSAIKKKEVQLEKNKIAIELEKSHQELRLLIYRQQTSLEEERMKIARDLHDELGQVLTALKIDVSMLGKKILSDKRPSDEVINNEFAAITKLIDKVTLSVKSISSGLRPETLDDLGIVEAIRWQAIEFEKRNEITCKAFLPSDPLDIDKGISIALFRIVQETLTNVVRHARASRVEIYLKRLEGSVVLEVKDNGKGIDEDQVLSSGSLGIIGLRERVLLLKGRFDIRGMSTGGTEVSILIPLNN
jgi:two-component system, NarL family, sensor histidine kinase UhpB